MPNHVTNIIMAKPHVLDALKGEGDVDFSALIPEPENIETGGCSGTHAEGEVCWFNWNIENWGTKWNAYSVERVKSKWSATERVIFDTAWNSPEPVIDALFDKFPDEEIIYVYADEDLGYNYGYRVRTEKLGSRREHFRDGETDVPQLIKEHIIPFSVLRKSDIWE